MLGGIDRDGYSIQYRFGGGEIGYDYKTGLFGCFYRDQFKQANSFIQAMSVLSEMERSDNHAVKAP